MIPLTGLLLSSCSQEPFETDGANLVETPFHGVVAGYFDPINLRTRNEFFRDVSGRSYGAGGSLNAPSGGGFRGSVGVSVGSEF